MLFQQLNSTVQLLAGNQFTWVGRNHTGWQNVQVGVRNTVGNLLFQQAVSHIVA